MSLHSFELVAGISLTLSHNLSPIDFTYVQRLVDPDKLLVPAVKMTALFPGRPLKG